MAVQQSMSVYNNRKGETVNRLVGTMREATNLCNGYVRPRQPHLPSQLRPQVFGNNPTTRTDKDTHQVFPSYVAALDLQRLICK